VKKIYIIVHTKEKGRLELTSKEWLDSGSKLTLHKEDGPAREYVSGHKEWYLNGERHREDGPAVIFPSGTREWWMYGKVHRVNGPAIEHNDGDRSWWINGERLSYEEFWHQIFQVEQLPLELKLIDPRWWVRDMKDNK
jgi:hypothetical protein